ncbi:MAG: protein kinase [Anaerolineales bacterium]|nr:protein kinase [Anaerolineales bacterium]
MSPEQAQGMEIDQRSDVYGLGVIVYQMLSGHQPYSADTPMGVVVKHITEPVPEILKILPTLQPEVDAVIKTAMAKDREQRYPNTIELAKALNTVAFGSAGNLTYHTNTGISPSLKIFQNNATFPWSDHRFGRGWCCSAGGSGWLFPGQ